jgi:alpha-beta hydrolase superfamily lysophospholipase
MYRSQGKERPEPMHVWAESFGIAAQDGTTIPVHRWRRPGLPRAVVVISHGLGEHALRYSATSRALVSAGHAVYANDHRGHGLAVRSRDMLGDFGRGGFEALVDDLQQVIWLSALENPGAPVFLLGHSLGAYAAQLFMLENSKSLAGVIMSGGAALDLRLKSVPESRAFLSTSDSGEGEPSAFAWLSRDAAVVDQYMDDPLCGFDASPDARKSLGAIAPRLRNGEEIRRIKADLPILMMTGERDPLNNCLLSFQTQRRRYIDAGLVGVSARVYAGARHEILNETNRAEVIADIMSWMDAVVASGSMSTRRTSRSPCCPFGYNA